MEYYIPKNIDEYIDILVKRKKLFFIPFFAVLCLAAAVYPFLPRVYEATALVLVEDQKMMNPLEGSPSRMAVDKQMKTLSAEILNWTNMLRLTQQVGVSEKVSDPAALERRIMSMRRRIDIRMLTDNIIQISYQDKDPQMAMLVANTVADNLSSKNLHDKEEATGKAIEFIRNQLDVYKDKLQNSEKTFFMNKVNSDLDDAQRKRALLRDQIAQMEKSSVVQGPKDESPVVVQLRRNLGQAEGELSQLLLNAKADSPMVQEQRSKIEDIKARLKAEVANQITSEVSSTNPIYQDELRQLKELDMQIDALQKRKGDLDAGKVQARNVSEQELSAMERDKKVNEDIYQNLLMRLENANISQQMSAGGQGGNFKLMDPARVPLQPAKPKPLLAVAGGLFFAFVAGFGTVFLREYFDSSFRNVDDAKDYLKLPVLAYVPEIVTSLNGNGKHPRGASAPSSNGSAKGNGLFARLRKKLPVADRVELTYVARPAKDPRVSPYVVSFHDPECMPSEQYRLFQTHLLYENKKTPIQTLLVTSAVEGEGKTSTSLNLAVTLATDLSRKVLLMDCDLRKGSMAKALGLDPSRGVHDFLTRKSELETLLQATPLERLTVLASGDHVYSPTKYLVSDRMSEMMEQLRSRFDFIVMDAPPVLNLSDVPVLSAHADGVVIVAQAGKTQRELVKASQALLEQSHRARVLGYVLTHVKNHVPAYFYSYIVRNG